MSLFECQYGFQPPLFSEQESEVGVPAAQYLVQRCRRVWSVAYQGPNQTNQDSIEAWLKHEEPNSTRQQQEDINQTPSPSEYSLQQDKESG